jgi:hypothetical protein
VKPFFPSASTICGIKTEHSELKPMKNLWDHTDLPCELVTSLMGVMSNWVGWWHWLDMPYGHISYTFSCFQFPKSHLSNLPCGAIHRHVGLVLIFLEDPVGDCACVHGVAWLEACLFRQFSFCHIHRECYRLTVLSVTDLCLAWF